MRVQAPTLAAENRPWCLVVVAGPMVGSRFELADAVTIGREAGTEIHLPEPSVSRRHCHVFRKRGGFWVNDLGATNPVRINGMQVKSSPLLEGDVLIVGDLMLKLLGPNSAENAMVAALHDQASKDVLTGIANRRHFRAEMERAFTQHSDLALIALDVDHFKSINDRFGHPAGDKVLTAVGATLRRHCPPPALPGRIGGEEFAVLLAANHAEACALAEQLRAAIEALQLEDEGREIRVTASFGVASRRPVDADADAIYARADAALYEAKRSGRNRVLGEA
nr:GGDEF domain-containing protein [Pseudomarimonas arenosa]